MTTDERLADEVLAVWETAQPSAVDVRLARAVKRLTAELATERAARIAGEGRIRTPGAFEACPKSIVRDVNTGMAECGSFAVALTMGCARDDCPIRSARGA